MTAIYTDDEDRVSRFISDLCNSYYYLYKAMTPDPRGINRRVELNYWRLASFTGKNTKFPFLDTKIPNLEE